MSLLSNSATVVHDSNIVSIEDVAEVIEDTGYGAELVQSRGAKGEKNAEKNKKVETVEEKDGEEDVREEVWTSTFMVGGMTCACVSVSA